MNEYTLTWTISVAADSPREAAEIIWQDVFGRTFAGADDACVFEVVGPDGFTETVDLSDEE